MIPMLEVQPGLFVIAVHITYVRVVSAAEARNDKNEMPAGVYYQTRDMEESKWIKIHPSLETQVANLMDAMKLRPIKLSPIQLPPN